ISVLSSGSRSPFIKIIEGVIWWLFLYSGVHIIRELLSVDKENFTAICLGVVVFLVAEKIVPTLSKPWENLEPYINKLFNYINSKVRARFPNLPSSGAMKSFTPLCEADIEMVAIHEVGHGIVATALGDFDISLRIYSDNDLGIPRGTCHHYHKGGRITDQNQIQKDMLIALAGQEAERLFLNKIGVGGREDFDYWCGKAKLYLSAGFSEDCYFPNPEAEWEIQANEKAISKLLALHREKLAEFLAGNKLLINEIANSLAINKKLSYEQLQPYFEQISGEIS
ncbi:MAG: hypothetical protein ACRC62_25765, partial [Microcoleus sp.]